MKRVELDFMVVPSHLNEMGYVKDAVRVKSIDHGKFSWILWLGASGRRLAEAGAHFFVSPNKAQELIEQNAAEEVYE